MDFLFLLLPLFLSRPSPHPSSLSGPLWLLPPLTSLPHHASGQEGALLPLAGGVLPECKSCPRDPQSAIMTASVASVLGNAVLTALAVNVMQNYAVVNPCRLNDIDSETAVVHSAQHLVVLASPMMGCAKAHHYYCTRVIMLTPGKAVLLSWYDAKFRLV